jgi:hypothetical protein
LICNQIVNNYLAYTILYGTSKSSSLYDWFSRFTWLFWIHRPAIAGVSVQLALAMATSSSGKLLPAGRLGVRGEVSRGGSAAARTPPHPVEHKCNVVI